MSDRFDFNDFIDKARDPKTSSVIMRREKALLLADEIERLRNERDTAQDIAEERHQANLSCVNENIRLREEVEAAQRKFDRAMEIKNAAINRWLPCPDHRDKTPPDYCPVCMAETARNAGLESAAQYHEQTIADYRIAQEGFDKASDGWVEYEELIYEHGLSAAAIREVLK